MEKSPTDSAVNGRASSSSSAEESGWTVYFEEFMASEEKRAASPHGGFSSRSSVAGGNSLISDAASCAAWKPVPAAGLEVSEKYRKLRVKRRKGKGLLDDDSLEDTASSPVNSPKVTDLSSLTTSNNPRSRKDIDQRCRESTARPEEESAAGFADGFDFAERANQCTDLKKRGLCLVPLSMFVDYV